MISNGDLFQPHLKIYLDILSNFYITFTICYYNTINIFHSSVHFFPVLVKGLYQTESYSLHVHVMQLIRIYDSRIFLFPHLVVWGRYCACEILIANTIDWLHAACLEYFIFFSMDSSEARKQYDEYCLLIWPNGSNLVGSIIGRSSINTAHLVPIR